MDSAQLIGNDFTGAHERMQWRGGGQPAHVVQPPQHQRDWGYEIVGLGQDPPPAPAPLS